MLGISSLSFKDKASPATSQALSSFPLSTTTTYTTTPIPLPFALVPHSLSGIQPFYLPCHNPRRSLLPRYSKHTLPLTPTIILQSPFIPMAFHSTIAVSIILASVSLAAAQVAGAYPAAALASKGPYIYPGGIVRSLLDSSCVMVPAASLRYICTSLLAFYAYLYIYQSFVIWKWKQKLIVFSS